jgi:hypothetical protein
MIFNGLILYVLQVTVELVESSNYTIKDKSVFSQPITASIFKPAYCKIIIIHGAQIFKIFVGKSIHEFKIWRNFIPTNTSCHVSILYITNMHRRFFADFCVMNAQRQGLKLLTSHMCDMQKYVHGVSKMRSE